MMAQLLSILYKVFFWEFKFNPGILNLDVLYDLQHDFRSAV